ncbi:MULTISPECIES: hypothetical protein [Aestuariibaculum]|uniref:Uncharacterized protein n=1 Tax=Aestuariibaculum marinum TaxID=2683592 RepID=A0A8J6PS44_9FLAO|nr:MULTISPECIES: hypothetical protein [Aestuariibaculum]MBD0823594.1 hypothetical protein [Aestuariibaculum marinum]WMI66412.1 hypothetical protein RBH94_04440 [Aestuariibaculum sp. YM273]
MQLPFRSEIRNSPKQQTIKIYLGDESLDEKIKVHLEHFKEIEHIEIRETVGQNRANENITVFLNDDVDIVKMQKAIDSSLWWYFEEDMVEE